jgi:hypothetical protein
VFLSSPRKLLAFAATACGNSAFRIPSHFHANTFGILSGNPSLCKYRSKAALLFAPELPMAALVAGVKKMGEIPLLFLVIV